MSITTALLCWFAAIVLFVMIYRMAVNGRLYGFYLFCGHYWAIAKEEVRRPLRVIRQALSRKEFNSKYTGREKSAEDIF